MDPSNAMRFSRQKASRTRYYGPDDPRTAEADRALWAEKIAAVIESAPPLTPVQRDRIRALLDGAPEAGEAVA